MNIFQLPDVSKTFMIESFYEKLFFLCMVKKKKSPEEEDVYSDAEQHGDDAVTN